MTTHPLNQPDVLVIGGGVIGLTTAYELAGRGVSVQLLEQGHVGREASWAGAGMLPPADPEVVPPERMLRAVSHVRWNGLAERLRDETGIDNGYHRAGGIVVAEDATSRETTAAMLAGEGVDVRPCEAADLADREPHLAARSGLFLPEMGQVRNPRHLKALHAACLARGADVREGEPVVDFETDGEHVTAVRTPTGSHGAGRFLVAGGAWSRSLLERVGVELRVEPVRGQIVLLRTPRPVLRHVVESGSRYLVPRPDGRLLIGSTEERVGFDKRNTAVAIAELLRFAVDLVPPLADAEVERTWAGLRPGSPDRTPTIDRVPHHENLFVAAGHFRDGLQQSPATALLAADLLLDTTPSFDPSPFRIGRRDDRGDPAQLEESIDNA